VALYEPASSDDEHVARCAALDSLILEPPSSLLADARLSAARHERRKARDEEVLALQQQGETLWSIAHRLNLPAQPFVASSAPVPITPVCKRNGRA